MKIHYYRIEIQGLSLTIGDLLDDIRVKPQAQRERSVHGKHVFLEHCSVINGLYEMEFTQAEDPERARLFQERQTNNRLQSRAGCGLWRTCRRDLVT